MKKSDAVQRVRSRMARASDESGFSMAEFMVASAILLVISAAVFSMLARTQRGASYQTEVQTVLENTRSAMDALTRQFRQAGNDPLAMGIDGLSNLSPTQVRIRSDVTGSAGVANPDKGDPDGDTLDAAEDVTIRYNAANQTVEIQPQGGVTQTVANNISAFSLEYYDAAGGSTSVGANVRKVRINLTGRSSVADPQTGRFFSVSLASDVQIAPRL